MNLEIDIVKAKYADVNILQQLAIETFIETYSWANTEENMKLYVENYFSEKQLKEDLDNRYIEHYIAYIDRIAVGYIKLNFAKAQTDIHDDESVEIERIYVLNAYQANRIGFALMNKALEVGIKMNKHYIWLGVWEKNEKAIRFYEKNGFVKSGTHIFKLGDEDQTDFIMRFQIHSNA